MDYSYINNDGNNWFLYRYGGSLQFTSDEALLDFIAAMKSGQDTMISAILNNNIFVNIAAGDVDAATAVIQDYFGEQSYFWIIGSVDDFSAAQFGADLLKEVFSELCDYIDLVLAPVPLAKSLELNRADPSRIERVQHVFEYLHTISQDPIKKAEWISQHDAALARRTSRVPRPALDTQKLGSSTPTWSITTFNGTGGETLTFLGNVPYTMPSNYSIVQQPARSFTAGTQVLSWYADVSWLSVGGDGYCVSWQTANGHQFAVNIWIPVNVFGVGSDPYYQVWYDVWGPLENNQWSTPPGGASAPFTFPSGWGYIVKVTPTSEGEDLFVEVDVAKDSS